MRKSIVALAIAASVPAISSAAPPVGFGTDGSVDGVWGITPVTNQIDHTCPAGFSCGSAPVSDANFLQVEMTNNVTKQTYFRTIIATGDASEKFVSESFVTSGTTNGGISAQQKIDSRQSNSGVLNSTTTLNTQSFNNGTTENQVDLTQDVWDTATAPQFHSGFGFTKDSSGNTASTTLGQEVFVTGEFADAFKFAQTVNTTTGLPTSTQLDILSGVNLNGTTGTLNDQTFTYVKRDGTAVVGTGTATMPNPTRTVSWAGGNAVERILIGQGVTSAGDFGYERVANNSVPASQITAFSLGALPPFSTITATSNPFLAQAGIPANPGGITIPAVPVF